MTSGITSLPDYRRWCATDRWRAWMASARLWCIPTAARDDWRGQVEALQGWVISIGDAV